MGTNLDPNGGFSDSISCTDDDVFIFIFIFDGWMGSSNSSMMAIEVACSYDKLSAISDCHDNLTYVRKIEEIEGLCCRSTTGRLWSGRKLEIRVVVFM